MRPGTASYRRFAHGLPLVVLLAALPHSVRAQRAVMVRIDNDAFNFWRAPWARPDEEYTSGVRLAVDYDGSAPWARRLDKWLGPCDSAPGACASHSYAVGQDIYTAVRPKDGGAALPGGRPDAGVLWVAATTRRVRGASRTELGWTVGVTGPPSLAESTQRFFHDLAPSFNRTISWGRQVPAEPVFAAQYDMRRLVRAGALDFQPRAGASLGNLLTEGRVGVDAELGSQLPHPWTVPPRSAQPFTLSLTGGATLRAVARNEVLNGTLFRRSAHVTPRTLVTEAQAGVHARWRNWDASWVAHQTSAEYAGRSAPHPWSTIALTWWPGR